MNKYIEAQTRYNIMTPNADPTPMKMNQTRLEKIEWKKATRKNPEKTNSEYAPVQ